MVHRDIPEAHKSLRSAATHFSAFVFDAPTSSEPAVNLVHTPSRLSRDGTALSLRLAPPSAVTKPGIRCGTGPASREEWEGQQRDRANQGSEGDHPDELYSFPDGIKVAMPTTFLFPTQLRTWCPLWKRPSEYAPRRIEASKLHYFLTLNRIPTPIYHSSVHSSRT